ncbi:MAG: hypothetical protein IPJ76_12875 [Flavobacteriales bacterium]|nr:MAG: hypothetical protein IPJ76_12875 [Flavobacteriales bacterium]
MPRWLYNVIQDAQGNVVVVGYAGTNEPLPDMNDVPTYVNPSGSGDIDVSGFSIEDYGSFGNKAYMAKYNAQGDLLWLNFYTAFDDLEDGWGTESIFWDVCEVTIAGQPTYVVVGDSEHPQSNGDKWGFVVHTDVNGNVLRKHSYRSGESTWDGMVPSAWFSGTDSRGGAFHAVDSKPGSQQVAISGLYTNVLSDAEAGGNLDIKYKAHCILMQLDLSQVNWYEPDFYRNTGDPNDPIVSQGGNETARQQNTTGVTYVNSGGTWRILWPVVSNFLLHSESAYNSIYARKSIASLKVHALSTAGALQWSSDLGEARAYDLQADGCSTDGGNTYSVVCTKWPAPFVHAPGGSGPDDDRFDSDDLSPTTFTCLETNFSQGPGVWAADEYHFSYWNTNAYVAKLNTLNGAVVWETDFDSDPTTEAGCYPDDMRKQECMYKVVEAPDGGLVVCGNTSHNFDDYYLAKLHSDCMGRAVSLIDYGNMPGTYTAADHTYTVAAAGESWNQDMDIHGIVRVPNGATLTITDAAKIRFADSRKLNYPTRIHVEVGGKLVVEGDALLTSMDQCPGSMWDGIVNMGSKFSQDESNFSQQGYVSLANCTVENARTAVACNSHFVDGETIPAHELQFAGGGVVRASNVLFSNNVRNVVMGPYENFQPGDNSNVRPNRSWFHRCRFETSATLTDNQRYPIEHAYLLGVRGVNFLGNTMINYGPFPAQVDGEMVTSDRFAGTGITAINTTLRVQGHCDVLVPVGTPCPPADFQRGRFEGLAQAMYVSSFDPGRTFIVDECDFNHCYSGVRMEGIQDAAITRSTFLVGEPQQGDWENVPYGVYSDQCTGYEIEENSFTATNTATKPMVGLVIKDSGPYSNRFYNNSFDGFDVDNSTGSIIEGVNADANTNYLEGLEVKCNDYGQVVKNSFDVGLTGPDVSVKNAQGEPMVLQTDYDKPAGNRFSVAHDGTFDTEEDWFVEDVSNFVEYFYHTPSATNRTEPTYRDLGWLGFNQQTSQWPGKTTACPSDLSHGEDPEEKRLASLAADGEKQDAEDAYDAAKDDGDTYSLLAYVSDGSKSSTQVRNALQSVAPKVSEEVWTAAFARNPAMSQLHIAQALLSNSPLQSEVLKLMGESGLGAYYQQLVWNAQDGTANILTLLESAIAYAAGTKAESLSDLGRLSWTVETDLNAALAALKSWHEGLPAATNAAAIGGVLAAKADETNLALLANTAEATAPTPVVYGVLKRYASGLEDADWTAPSVADETWLESVAVQRDVIGSAHAQTWLNALGHSAVPEIIHLPPMNRAPRPAVAEPLAWTASQDVSVTAYPNPTNSGTVLDIRLPEGREAAQLRIGDVTGRVLVEQSIGGSQRLLDIETGEWPNGLYFTEVWLENDLAAVLKLAVQH